MNNLLKLAESSENILKPFGKLDILLFYGIIAKSNKKFLKGRELASKNWLPGGIPYLIKRGSKEKPLYIEDMINHITPEFLEIRAKTKKLSDAENINSIQKNIWNYFLPRKLSDFFYATNNEGHGKPIDRIFFDIDKTNGVSNSDIQKTAAKLCELAADSSEIKNKKIFVYWTGASFHIILMLSKKYQPEFYHKYFEYHKDSPLESLTGKWASEINKNLKIKVIGGHIRYPKTINIDPSQTPSGKLCRVPLGSLHMKDAKHIDGISIPLKQKMLYEKGLVEDLKKYTPEQVMKEIKKLEKRLP